MASSKLLPVYFTLPAKSACDLCIVCLSAARLRSQSTDDGRDVHQIDGDVRAGDEVSRYVTYDDPHESGLPNDPPSQMTRLRPGTETRRLAMVRSQKKIIGRRRHRDAVQLVFHDAVDGVFQVRGVVLNRAELRASTTRPGRGLHGALQAVDGDGIALMHGFQLLWRGRSRTWASKIVVPLRMIAVASGGMLSMPKRLEK